MNRQKSKVIGQVLELAQEEITITQLVHHANISTSRLQKLLSNLTSNGLIVKIGKYWVITDNGRIYLNEYKKFYEMAASYGLEL